MILLDLSTISQGVKQQAGELTCEQEVETNDRSG